MSERKMPRVLQDELNAVYAQLDAAREATREARRLNERRFNVIWWCVWSAIGVSMLTRSWLPNVAGAVACVGNYVWWWRNELRAREIENSASRALWPRINLLCIALDAAAPRVAASQMDEGYAP
jgi:hypothetical protein